MNYLGAYGYIEGPYSVKDPVLRVHKGSTIP